MNYNLINPPVGRPTRATPAFVMAALLALKHPAPLSSRCARLSPLRALMMVALLFLAALWTVAPAQASGSVGAFGSNQFGQLGNGSTASSSTVVRSATLTGISKISAGTSHSLALKSDGSVVAWGRNGSGELGDGTMTQSLTSIAVSGLGSGVAAISAGNNFSMALKSDGSVVAWGSNGNGQLGDGTTTRRLTPVAVSGLSSGVIAISAGTSHALAIKSDGSVVAWGYNGYGELGDGTTTQRLTPVAVTGLGSGVKAISAGQYFSLLLKSDGSVVACGYNYDGELGDNTAMHQITPVAVSGLSGDVIAISAGQFHAMALKGDGSVMSWGSNQYGQLGDGTYTRQSLTPVAVIGLSAGTGVVAISAGGSHSLALKSDGTVVAWGTDGSGASTPRNTLVGVIGLNAGSGVSAISAGSGHSLIATGSGNSAPIAIADSVRTAAGLATPISVLSNDTDLDGDTLSIASVTQGSHGSVWFTSTSLYYMGNSSYSGNDFFIYTISDGNGGTSTANVSISVAEQGALYSWGNNNNGQLGDSTTTNHSSPQFGGANSTKISAGTSHSLALKSDGSVVAWGSNQYGRLGDGTITQRLTPMAVTSLSSGVIAISAGTSHSLALKSDGSVVAWGYNGNGELGDGTMTQRLTPVAVTGLSSGVIAISAGQGYSLALKSDGSVLAWGDNHNAQLGDGTTTSRLTPVAVTTLSSGVTVISAGSRHSLALKSDGSVVAWGYNDYGQLGDGTTTQRLTPVAVTGLSSGVIAISAGTSHSLALKSDGSVVAWGYNGNGQLGDGTTTRRLTPMAVSGLSSGVIAISTGTSHSVALKSDGTVVAWGYNDYGQLGDGTTTQRNTPVTIAGFKATALDAGGSHSLAIPAKTAPVASTTTLSGTQNSVFTGQLIASDADNNALTYTLVTGTLPDGLVLNPNTGAITGKPTAIGVSNLTFKVNDGTVDSNTATATITIAEAQSLEAQSLVVTMTSDTVDNTDGMTSLREAIAFANSDADSSAITFASNVTGSITLKSQLEVSSNLSVVGPGAKVLTLSGGGTTRHFFVKSGADATLSGLTLRDGLANDSGGAASTSTRSGGAILNEGTLVILDCALSGNRAVGALPLNSFENSTFGRGGAIQNSGALTLRRCTLTGNTAQGGPQGGGGTGGAILSGSQPSHSLTMESCILSGNTALATVLTNPNFGSTFSRSAGGAVTVSGGTALFQSVTVTNNKAQSDGVGVSSSGGGLDVGNATLTMQNSLIAGNSARTAGNTAGFGPDIARLDTPNPATINFCLLGNPAGATFSGSNNLTNVDAKLGPLQDNGGPTQTIALLPGSPAVDAGSNALIPSGVTTDQRGQGFARVARGTIDIGAYEVQNAQPVVTGFSKTLLEDGSLTFATSDFSAAFSDADDTLQSVRIDTLPDNGTLNFDEKAATANQVIAAADLGKLSFAPAANFNGSTSFNFNGSDAYGFAAKSARLTLNVTAVNDVPSFTVGANQTVTEDAGAQTTARFATNISAGPADEKEQALTFSVTTPQSALFSVAPAIAADGTLTFTPAANANGTATVSVALKDDGGTADGGADTSLAQTFTLTITAVNDAPVANAQSVSTDEDTSKAILLSASDVDNANLTYRVVSGPKSGTLSGAAPNLTYVPNADFNGTDSFSFVANDGTVDSVAVVVSITTNAINDAPVAIDRSEAVGRNAATAFTLRATDVDGNALTYTVVGQPIVGTLSGTAPNLTYTPRRGYAGNDTLTFKANDGTVDSNTATVTFVVGADNSAPIAFSQKVATDEEKAIAVALTANDNDGDNVTYDVIAQPKNGTLSGSAPNLTYTPAADFNGADSFSFSANDGTVDGNIATISIDVNAINDAPSFVVGAAQTVAENSGAQSVAGFATGIKTGPADEIGQMLSFIVTNSNTALFSVQPAISADGTLTYTLAPNAAGSANVSVKVHDSGGIDKGGVDTSAAQSFTITVTPNTINLGVSLTPTGPFTRDTVTAKPVIVDGTGITYSYEWFVNGKSVQKGAGDTLDLSKSGFGDKGDRVSVTVSASNTRGGSGNATDQVTVRNSMPIAISSKGEVPADTEKGFVLQFFDADGDAVTYKRVGGPVNGVTADIRVDPTDGKLKLFYRSRPFYGGVDIIRFVVFDSDNKQSNESTLGINVLYTPPPPANRAPIAGDTNIDTYVGKSEVKGLLGSDPDGDAITFRIVGNAKYGKSEIKRDTDGQFKLFYTSLNRFYGDDRVTYLATDSRAKESNLATVNIHFTNRAPLAQGNRIQVASGALVSQYLFGTDEDGDALSFRLVNNPRYGKGEVKRDEQGKWRFYYQSLPNYVGPDQITLIAIDPMGKQSSIATIDINVVRIAGSSGSSAIQGGAASSGASS